MKTARLVTTSSSGTKRETDDIILVCSPEDARIIFDALDLYCTANQTNRRAAELYHSLGWNSGYMGSVEKAKR